MNRTTATFVLSVMLLAAIVLIGLSCSHDSSLAPTDANPVLSAAVSEPANPLPEPSFVETFDKHSNVGNWSFFGNPDVRVEVIEMDGGNPGAFMHARCDLRYGCLDTYAPQLRTPIGEESIFTGDYRAKKVTRVGVDLAIFGPEIVTTEGRPLSLLLRNDNGTPYEWSDDVVAFWTGSKPIPHECGQFKEFTIEVPYQSETLPKGWGILPGYSTGDDNADWNKAITGVSQITFFFGDPVMFFMFQQWELGVDNPRIWFDE